MNGMFAGLEERRREIGIYLAVGAKPGDIVRSVLLEAILVCLLGGATGCFLGATGSLGVSMALGLPSAMQISDFATALAVSGLCGVVFGTIPAIKSAHLDPIAALNRN